MASNKAMSSVEYCFLLGLQDLASAVEEMSFFFPAKTEKKNKLK